MQINLKSIKRFIPIINKFNKSKGKLIFEFNIKIYKNLLKEEDELEKYVYVERSVSKEILDRNVIKVCISFTTFGYYIIFGKYKVFGKDIKAIKDQINKLPVW